MVFDFQFQCCDFLFGGVNKPLYSRTQYILSLHLPQTNLPKDKIFTHHISQSFLGHHKVYQKLSALSQQHNTNTTNHLHLTQLSILPPTRLLKKSSFTILALHSRSQSFSWTNVEGGPLGWTAWRSFEGPPFDAVSSSGTRWDPPLILFGASGASSGFKDNIYQVPH